MKELLLILLGAAIFTGVYSCAAGGKRPNFDDFPVRSKEFSVWMRCRDGGHEHVCKYECGGYNRANECKEGQEKEVRMYVKEALDSDYIVISKALFLQLISGKN